MPTSAKEMENWCRGILGDDPQVPKQSLEALPAGDSAAGVVGRRSRAARRSWSAATWTPSRARSVGEGDIRLRSMKETLEFGRQKGLEADRLRPHRPRAGEIARQGPRPAGRNPRLRGGLRRRLARSGHDHGQGRRRPRRSGSCPRAACIVLENTRKYDIERVLWKAKPADLPKLAEQLARLANEMAEKVAKVYVHEAFSAGSLDASSVVVPAAMERVALGRYEAEQFDGQLQRLPGRPDGRLQRAEGRQARRPGSDDQPRQDPPGDHGRLAGHGPEEGGRRAGGQATSTWAWPKTRPTPTSPTSFPATASSRPSR